MIYIPFFSNPDDEYSPEDLKVGDRVRVKQRVPIWHGKTGTLEHISDVTGDCTVKFDNGQVVGFDGDDLLLVKSQDDDNH